ncbi:MAG: DUF2493 domain-containing protein [Clostridia bacterium]|nr:DUF2493 domain-containing protein [Clostridia bacterium]
MKYRIIIAGSRSFNDFDLLKKVLDDYLKNAAGTAKEFEIIGGGAMGADTLGEKYAHIKGIPFRLFLPDWKRYGKAAGLIRNNEMAKYAAMEIGVLFAFWDGESKGTKNMILSGKATSLEIHIIEYGDKNSI